MQKLVFLVQQEAIDEGVQVPDVHFLPYKYGPYSQELRDDIDVLTAAGYLESAGQGLITISDHTITDISHFEASAFLSQGSLNSDTGEEVNPDTMDEAEVADQSPTEDDNTTYRLTAEGRKYAEKLEEEGPELLRVIQTVKARHGFKTLSELLRYVYAKYPSYTTESEIRDRIVGNDPNAG